MEACSGGLPEALHLLSSCKTWLSCGPSKLYCRAASEHYSQEGGVSKEVFLQQSTRQGHTSLEEESLAQTTVTCCRSHTLQPHLLSRCQANTTSTSTSMRRHFMSDLPIKAFQLRRHARPEAGLPEANTDSCVCYVQRIPPSGSSTAGSSPLSWTPLDAPRCRMCGGHS